MTSTPPPPPPRSFPPPPPSAPRARGRFAESAGSADGGGEPPARSGRSPVFWMGMGCMGCLVLPVLLALGFAGALGGGVFYFTRAPVRVVEAQLAELRDGQIDKAYARLSSGYRAQLSRDGFADMVEQHVALRDNKSASFWNRSLVNDEMTLGGTLTARSGATETVGFELVREQGEWKISAIRFGAAAKGQKL